VTDPANKGIIGRMAGKVTGRVVETVDPDVILEYVDVDALLDRIDVNKLLARIDPNVLLDRVDIQRLLDRVDIDELLADVDLEALVKRSGVPDIITSSTKGFATSALDLARRQILGLDAVIDRILLRRREPADTPPLLAEPADAVEDGRLGVSGHYAGGVSRAAASALDVGTIFVTFTLGIAGLNLLLQAFFGTSVDEGHSVWATVSLVVWAFFYVVVGLVISGRSVGKGVIGLMVVRADGATLTPGRALVRTLALPLSAILFIGFIMVLFNRRHRALHDYIAGTVVVYDWGDRRAELPTPLSAFLERK
jgi:uncharacterized RDD family membrane protein YckC